MRFLGLLLILFGIALLVIHFFEMNVPAMDWVNNWGEDVAWGVRFAPILFGFVLTAMGGKGKDKKKK